MKDLFYGATTSSKESTRREQFSQYPVHISAHKDLYDALESTLINDANLEDLDMSRPADEVRIKKNFFYLKKICGCCLELVRCIAAGALFVDVPL